MRRADNSQGPMTIPYFSGSIVAFLPLPNITNDYASILAKAESASPLPRNTDPTVLAGYDAQRKQLLAIYAATAGAVEEVAWAGGNTVSVAMIRPFSRGSININSTDPNEAPVVNFGTFSHPTDLDVAVASLRKVRQWIDSVPMQEVGAVETYPGRNVTSDSDIAAAIRNFATSSWQHPTSTCAMLPRQLGGVVDSELRVYGVKGLRIVDASIFPMSIAGHTSSTVYAVAEKAADIIKAAQK
jgi:choline dehydrogenase-like flavoprotein